jgi:hypothetical protein
MYITLTNASKEHKGNKIAINCKLIATVHDAVVAKESGLFENVTYIFCPPHGSWEVQESLEEIVAELNNLEWNKI